MSLPPHRVSFSYQDLRKDTILNFSLKNTQKLTGSLYIYIYHSQNGPAASAVFEVSKAGLRLLLVLVLRTVIPEISWFRTNIPSGYLM
jgi:hypothetical protein